MLVLVRELTEAFIMALVVFVLLQLTVQNYRVEGASMVPTISAGEYVTVNKLAYLEVDMIRISRLIPFWSLDDVKSIFLLRSGGPRRGDIVVFRFPENPDRNFIKRVVGLPGERVSLRRGSIYINNSLIEEPYIQTPIFNESKEFESLANNEYFVMGDNRPFSNDSRHWGPVPLQNIVGLKWLNYELPFEIGLVGETE